MATKEVRVCAPCKSRGILVRGVRYCVVCQEPLCRNCVEYHKAFKVTKNHTMTQTVLTRDSDISENTLICPHHPHKITEFYCENDGTFLCSHCLHFSDSHKNCPKPLELESAGKYLIKRNFTENIKESGNQLLKSAEKAVKEITQGNQCTSECLKDMRSEIENIRKKMLEAFDRQTNHIIETISKDILQNRSNCEHAMLIFEKFKKGMTEKDICLKTAIDGGDTASVFRGAVSMIKQFEQFGREVEWTKTNCARLHIKFEKSDLVESLETDQNPLLICNIENTTLALPDISSKNFKTVFKSLTSRIQTNAHASKPDLHSVNNKRQSSSSRMTDTRSMHSPSDSYDIAAAREQADSADVEKTLNHDIKLSSSFSVDMKLPDGDEQPFYNGIVCLPDERIILSDSKMSRLIIVKNNFYHAHKNTEFKPGNLALFNQFILVCLMKTNRLLMMKIVGNDLKEYRYLPTRYHPKCVQAIDGEKIIVSSVSSKDEWSLEVMTYIGQTFHTDTINVDISGYLEGTRLAVQSVPAFNVSCRFILFSEKSKCLKCLSMKGKLEVFCSDIEKATSVLTDQHGYVFVTRFPGEVQVFSPDGHLLRIYPRKSLHGVKYAALNNNADRLYIITNKNARIHIIDVKR